MTRWKRLAVLGLTGCLTGCLAALGAAPAPATPRDVAAGYGVGDVFLVLFSSTKIHEFTPQGTPVQQLEVPDRYPETTAFDQQGDLLVGTFFGPIDEFDPQGNYVGVFADPSHGPLTEIVSTMTVDAAGHVFVGELPQNYNETVANVVHEYAADGTLVDQFRVRTQDHAVDAMDLAADQCTLYYRSGHLLLTYDVCTRTQGKALDRHLPAASAGLRLVPGTDDEILTSDYRDIQLRSSTGRVLRTYHPEPFYTGDFDDLALAPDGTSFWTIDSHDLLVFRIRISDGRLLKRFHVHVSSGDSGDAGIGGLGVYGEPTVGRTGVTP